MTPKTGEPGARSGRLPLIDSLRAIAALSIFAYHSLFVTGNLSQRDYGAYLNFGVPLFYAISGLLLYLPFARAIGSAGEGPSVRAYARHRLFRIIPAYWVALPVVAVVLVETAEVFTPEGVVTYFGFLQIYRLETFVGGIGQAWTLCVEMSFYAFLPLWALICSAACRRVVDPRSRLRAHLAMIGLLVVASTLWKVATVILVGDDVGASLVPLTVLPAAIDQFAVGMVTAVLLTARSQGVGPARLLSAGERGPLAGVLVAALAYLLFGEVRGVGFAGANSLGWQTKVLLEHELYAVIAAGLLLAAVCARPAAGAVGRVLGFGPLRRIGEISYGVYLWHLMILIVFAGAVKMGSQVKWIGGSEGLIGGWAGVAVAFAATLAISAASWQLLERRLIARSHRRPR